MKRAIYLITGVMASGKSTVAELLASKMDKGVHLRGDVFRRMIVSGGAIEGMKDYEVKKKHDKGNNTHKGNYP